MEAAYQPIRVPETQRVEVRALPYCVHTWGEREWPVLMLLHGWADVGRSFQFLVDELDVRFRIIAPDWRGFGDSGWAPDGYWFPDYLGDLDALLDLFSLDGPAALVGHSMGGNVAGLYAGVRPGRVSHLILLDGFGLQPTEPSAAPGRYRRWLDSLREDRPYRTFASMDDLADYLMGRDPHLMPARARFLAHEWGRQGDDGVTLRLDPAHRRVNPILYRRQEARACWSQVTSPVLLLVGEDSPWRVFLDRDETLAELRNCFPGHRRALIKEAGHMLHHDQPAAVAAHIRRFLTG